MKIGIVAGEVSGDQLGAGFIREFTASTSAAFRGVGGQEMEQAGCQNLFDMERLAVMGLIEPFFRLPELISMRRQLVQNFTKDKPDLFLGIDAPDFNLGLEAKLRRSGIPTVHYVSPSVWAWRPKRIFKIAQATDLVLTLFPFEAAFYEKHNVPACYVGHPLADKIPLVNDRQAARLALNLAPDDIYIALLPGSRQNELKYLAKDFILAAQACWQQFPHVKFITSAVNATRDLEFKKLCEQLAPNLPIVFVQQRSHAVMAAANIILVTSGTATLEAMLFKRPMVIAYRMANFTYQLAKHLVKTPFIGLPNILAQELLVPEFIQAEVTPNNLSYALIKYLESPELVEQLAEKFMTIHQTLRCNASAQAVQAVKKLLKI
jgi:lipid-A-disaccharide synthase